MGILLCTAQYQRSETADQRFAVLVLLRGAAVILALFPQITFFFANVLQIESPVNLLFLFMFAILIYRSFRQSIRISQLDNKIKELTQNLTIYEKKNNDAKDETDK